MKAALSAQINKSDPQWCSRHYADDACWPVLTSACDDAGRSEAPHAADQSPAFAGKGARGIENDLRGPLPFGLKVGMVTTVKFRLEFRDL
jgi:hypothetical protein